jgi:hypothetical protein
VANRPTVYRTGNLQQKIIRFSDIMQFSYSFWGDQKCH